MRFAPTAPLIAVLFVATSGAAARAAADASFLTDDEQLLKAAKIGTDGPALLEFFRIRARPEADPDKLATLVAQMGNDSDRISSRATRELISLGTVAVPWLRRALKDPDDSLTAKRAQFCLENIEGSGSTAIPMAAARFLAISRPQGTAQVLLSYLPFAEDDTIIDELRDTLATVALIHGRTNRALVDALRDKLPIRRAVAAEALCQAGARLEVPQIRYLLRDPKPTVQLRAAVALANFQDQEAIPVLIDVLAKLPPDQAGAAEKALLHIAGTGGPSVPLGTNEVTRKRCRDTWNLWWHTFKDNTLVEYFRKRTLPDADRSKFQALIHRLGNDSYRVRERAVAELVGYRNAAVSFLNQALKDTDVQIVRNAERCLAKINAAPLAGTSATYARVIGLRKPAGAVKVLLGYLPFADDDTVADEVRNALSAMALEEGRPHHLLIAALHDPLSARRAAAAEALLRSGVPGSEAGVADLLADRDTTVRLRVATALAEARDKKAVPVLIDLLTQLPTEEAWKAEETLGRLADDKAPALALGDDVASRKKCRDAWVAWWKQRGGALDLAQLSHAPRLLGYTIIAQYNNFGNGGQIYEIGKDGKVRWKIDGIQYAFDFQILPRKRLLIPEYSSSRVTERDFKGKVLWEMSAQNPINAQRLPNGNTFIAGRNFLMEVDRNKKEVFKINRQNYDIMGAQKLRNGQIMILSNGGTCIRMDTKGKELKAFSVGQVNYYGCLEALPNGHVLVANYNASKVVEYTADGKSVWEASTQWPTGAVRLPNGHTLIASQDGQRVIEVNRGGKQVWEHKTDGRPWRVRRR
jgi:HEAT repeat protein